MCWYHECVVDGGQLRFLPRMCGIGSRISYNYIQGMSNPCTINFDSGKRTIYQLSHLPASAVFQNCLFLAIGN